jgi:hypothetical protein
LLRHSVFPVSTRITASRHIGLPPARTFLEEFAARIAGIPLEFSGHGLGEVRRYFFLP